MDDGSSIDPGTPPGKPPAPSLADLEKLYGGPATKPSPNPRSTATKPSSPSLSDLEKLYGGAPSTGNVDLRTDGPRTSAPAASPAPAKADDDNSIGGQLKAFGRNLQSADGLLAIGKGAYHGIADPLATTAAFIGGSPEEIDREVEHSKAQQKKPTDPWYRPQVATDPNAQAGAMLSTAAAVLPIGELAGKAIGAIGGKVAPAATERVAELLGTKSAAGMATRAAKAGIEGATHGAGIGAASDPDHPGTSAELGALMGGTIGAVGAPIVEKANEAIAPVVGKAKNAVKARIGQAILDRQEAAANARRTGTNYWPEEQTDRLLEAKNKGGVAPPAPKVDVNPAGPQQGPTPADFEVEGNAPPTNPTELAKPETPPAPSAPEAPPAPVKLLPAGRAGTPTEAPAGVQLPPDDAVSFLDDRIKAALEQRDVAQRAAETDGLTGIGNATAYQRALPNAEAHPGTAVVRFDVNGMKGVNDALGHPAGDVMLQRVSQSLVAAAAQTGIHARLFRPGGDEFAALVPAAQADAFRTAAEQTYGVVDHAPGVRSSLSGGIGNTDVEADQGSYARKAEQKAQQGIPDRAPTPAPVADKTAALPPDVAQEPAKGAEAPSAPEAPAVAPSLDDLETRYSGPAASEPPARVAEVPTAELHADPVRFQYKQDVDESGVTRELKSVTRYNPELAGVLSAWRDPADGKTYVINGHHRLDLAKRTGQPSVLVQYIDAADAAQARGKGALVNIAEGRGTALDAGKFLRESGHTPEELKEAGISPTGKIAKDGVALSKLDPAVFGKVARGVISEGHGALIGDMLENVAEQRSAAGLIENAPRTPSLAEAREIIHQVREAGSEHVTQDGLFGTEDLAKSLIHEKAALSSEIGRRMASDKRLFGFVAKGGRASELERGGNKIDVERSKAIGDEAAQASEQFGRVAYRKGPVGDIMNEGARRIANGETAKAVATSIYDAITEAVRSSIPGAALGQSGVPEKGAHERQPTADERGPAVHGDGSDAEAQSEPDPNQGGFSLGERPASYGVHGQEEPPSKSYTVPEHRRRSIDASTDMMDRMQELQDNVPDDEEGHSYIPFRRSQIIDAVGEGSPEYKAELAERAKRLDPKHAEQLSITFGSPEEGLAAADHVVTIAGKDADVTYTTPTELRGTPGANLTLEQRKANVAKGAKQHEITAASFTFVGKVIRSSEHTAMLSRVGRDPRMEHLQVFGTDDDGNVVGHERWTSGAINYVGIGASEFVESMAGRMYAAGATKIRLSHNHPSGVVDSSPEDRAVTLNVQPTLDKVAHRLGRKPLQFVEHVIIDHDKYRVLTVHQSANPGGYAAVPMLDENTYSLDPAKIEKSDWTQGVSHGIRSERDMIATATANVRDGKGVSVLYLDIQNQVLAEEHISTEQMRTQSPATAAAIAAHMKPAAAINVAFVTGTSDAAQAAINLANRLAYSHGVSTLDVVQDTGPGAHPFSAVMNSALRAPAEKPITDATRMSEPRPQLGMFGDEPAPAPSKKDQLGMFGANDGTKLAQDEAVKLKNKDSKIGADELVQRRDELGAPKQPAIKAGEDQGALLERGGKYGDASLRETPAGYGGKFAASTRRAFNPMAESDEAERAGRILRDVTGQHARDNARMGEAMKPIVKLFRKVPRAEQLAFIDRVERGQPQPTPELQAIHDAFRGILDSARKAVQDLGTGKLESWIEDYFPHIWKDPNAAKEFFFGTSKGPLEGGKSFLKKRTIPFTSDGVAAGLEPVTTNPAELVMLKVQEMNKYIMGTRLHQTLTADGLEKWVSSRRKGPQGWTKIDDPSAVKYGPPTIKVAHTEAFDADVREAVEGVLKDLGIQHDRSVSDPKAGGQTWGYAEHGNNRMWSKRGGDIGVILHELGHKLDFKFGLYDHLIEKPKKRTTAGGRQVSADKPAEIARRKELNAELRALADMRYKGQVGPTFEKYVRNRYEKIANALHAVVFAPELAERLAPNITAKLRAFLSSHAETAPLLTIERGVRLGTGGEVKEYDTGGVVIMAHRYAPDAAARVINNYLSPGLRGSPYYNAYMGVGNVLNAAQLGFSAFHLGFTSLDASVSKFALAIEQIMAGEPLDALKSVALSPVAPITNIMRGNKLMREYLKPGSVGGEFFALADGVATAGGRAKMDDWYRVGQWGQMQQAMTEAIRGQTLGTRAAGAGEALLRVLPAILEVSAKPLLEFVVPRQKLGVFADLAQFEVKQLAKKYPHGPPPDAVRAALQRAWDSVDNRMGQMVYDNLFWNKVGKDLSHGLMRSVGWNVGTVREIGGGVGDVGHALLEGGKAAKRVASGEKWSDTGRKSTDGRVFTHKMAYMIALPVVVGLLGAMVQYLYTGEGPSELKDLYYPRTGRKTPEGDEARLELPSYMKDIGGLIRHPVDTILHKTAPLLNLISSILQNENYYGNQIQDLEAPAWKRVEQVIAEVGRNFAPFSVQGAIEQKRRGASRADQALPMIGITPAPKEVTRTDAQQAAYEIARRKAQGIRTPTEAAASAKRADLIATERTGGDVRADLSDMLHSGEISPADARRIIKAKLGTSEVKRFQSLTLEQAEKVMDKATPDERVALAPIVARKRRAAAQRHGLKVGQR